MNIYGKAFARIYDKKWSFWGPKVWSFLYKKIKAGCPSSRTLLDLCCGTGSLIRLASKQGYICTGIDKSPHQIWNARRNAPSAKFFIQDIRKLSVKESFDIITCMFDSLNYLTRTRDLVTVFRKAGAHLNPGGLFIFDMNTYEGLEDGWRKTFVIHDPGFTVITESSFEKITARGRCLITGFIKTKGNYARFQEEHIERGYKPREIERCLDLAGFSYQKYDGNTLKAPGKRAGRLLYICNLTRTS